MPTAPVECVTTMYRHVEQVRDRIGQVQNHLRDAILANDTRDISLHGGAAQTEADQLVQELREALGLRDAGVARAARVERQFVELAVQELSMAVSCGERMAAATDVTGMRDGLLQFKTHTDYAAAYIHYALGA